MIYGDFRKLRWIIAILWLVLRFIFVYVLKIGNILGNNVLLIVSSKWENNEMQENWKRMKCETVIRKEIE